MSSCLTNERESESERHLKVIKDQKKKSMFRRGRFLSLPMVLVAVVWVFLYLSSSSSPRFYIWLMWEKKVFFRFLLRSPRKSLNWWRRVSPQFHEFLLFTIKLHLGFPILMTLSILCFRFLAWIHLGSPYFVFGFRLLLSLLFI